MPKLLFLVANDRYFCSHRLNLAIAAKKNAYQVAIATKCYQDQETIEKAGIQVFPLKHFTRSGLNPWQQCLAFYELFKIYKHYQPDIVHHVAMKPVIFGTFVARYCKVPKIINALGGLGYLFTHDSKKLNTILLKKIVCLSLKWLFAKENVKVILQNSDDINTLVNAGCIKDNKATLIRGAGVDINAFPVKPLPAKPPLIIACVTRMLWDKGIGELVSAADILHKKNIPVKFMLYGEPDPENPSSIDKKQLQAWHDRGIIHWQGYCHNIAEAYANCHIAVLLSYREGLPKSLLEAASCGRAIITSDVPGCREVVSHGKNGFLIPPRNIKAFVEVVLQLLEKKNLLNSMGKEGRRLVETLFHQDLVTNQTLKLYNE